MKPHPAIAYTLAVLLLPINLLRSLLTFCLWLDDVSDKHWRKWKKEFEKTKAANIKVAKRHIMAITNGQRDIVACTAENLEELEKKKSEWLANQNLADYLRKGYHIEICQFTYEKAK